MSEASHESEAIKVFYSYAHEDEGLRKKLEKHLSTLRRLGVIVNWHDRKIKPGVQFDPEIVEQIDASRIILLLVSADFIDSDYIYNNELKRALERHLAGQSRTIPVILRPCEWKILKVQVGEQTPQPKSLSLGELNALPTDGEPVTSKKWDSEDAALNVVAVGIRATVSDMIPELFSDDEPIEPPPPAPPGTDEVVYHADLGMDSQPRPSMLRAMLANLRAFARDVHLTLLEHGQGSLRLILRGSREGFERLRRMYQEGELTHLFGFEIRDLEHLEDVEKTGGSESGAPGMATAAQGAAEEDEDFDVGQVQAQAHLFEERGDFAGARLVYFRGAKTAEARGDSFSSAVLINDWGIFEKKIRKFDSARRLFDFALNIFVRLGAHDAVKTVRGNLDEVNRMEKADTLRHMDVVIPAPLNFDEMGLGREDRPATSGFNRPATAGAQDED